MFLPFLAQDAGSLFHICAERVSYATRAISTLRVKNQIEVVQLHSSLNNMEFVYLVSSGLNAVTRVTYTEWQLFA